MVKDYREEMIAKLRNRIVVPEPGAQDDASKAITRPAPASRENTPSLEVAPHAVSGSPIK